MYKIAIEFFHQPAILFPSAWVAEQVDARDLKSLGVYPCTSSILVPGTNENRKLKAFILSMDKRLFLFLLILYIICTSFLSDGNNYSRPKQDKEKLYLPGSLVPVRITWPACHSASFPAHVSPQGPRTERPALRILCAWYQSIVPLEHHTTSKKTLSSQVKENFP